MTRSSPATPREKGWLVDKINEFKLTLKDLTKSVDDRRFALRFLIHCVEDLHQPATPATPSSTFTGRRSTRL
jgi:hypothetical protein